MDLDAPARSNVQLIAAIEREAQHRRTVTERVSDSITRLIGSLWFVLLHVLLFVGWVLVNAGWVPGIAAFDPFPYGILTLFVSAEGVLLAIFVLVSQNRMSADANRRAQLDLQMSLLTEQTSTKTLQILRELSARLGVVDAASDREAQKLASRTDVTQLMRDLEQTLPRD